MDKSNKGLIEALNEKTFVKKTLHHVCDILTNHIPIVLKKAQRQTIRTRGVKGFQLIECFTDFLIVEGLHERVNLIPSDFRNVQCIKPCLEFSGIKLIISRIYVLKMS